MDYTEIDINSKKDDFIELLEQERKRQGVETNKELREKLPPQKSTETGTIILTDITGISLTSEGILTRNEFFSNMESTKLEQYGDIVLTEEEARKLMMSYKKMSTGVNAAVPLTCQGTECPFAKNCPYVELGKEPLGKPCLVEADLLNYHTTRFINEFDVDVNEHSEIMLIQELSELIIMETRVTNVLAEPKNASLYGIKESVAADGTIIQEEVEHWAWGLKEKMKTRRMKILESLNATRKSKSAIKDYGSASEEDNTKTARVNKMIAIMDQIKEDMSKGKNNE